MLKNEGHFKVIGSELTEQTSSDSVSITIGMLTTDPSVGGCGGVGHSGAEK